MMHHHSAPAEVERERDCVLERERARARVEERRILSGGMHACTLEDRHVGTDMASKLHGKLQNIRSEGKGCMHSQAHAPCWQRHCNHLSMVTSSLACFLAA